MTNPIVSGFNTFGATRFVLDTELPHGWCRFTGNDGLEYGGPLSNIPKGVVTAEVTIASDIWENLHRHLQRAKLEELLKRDPMPAFNAPVGYTPWPSPRGL
jgi:hypothetical protein